MEEGSCIIVMEIIMRGSSWMTSVMEQARCFTIRVRSFTREIGTWTSVMAEGCCWTRRMRCM